MIIIHRGEQDNKMQKTDKNKDQNQTVQNQKLGQARLGQRRPGIHEYPKYKGL